MVFFLHITFFALTLTILVWKLGKGVHITIPLFLLTLFPPVFPIVNSTHIVYTVLYAGVRFLTGTALNSAFRVFKEIVPLWFVVIL
jgi:hypothetical protein